MDTYLDAYLAQVTPTAPVRAADRCSGSSCKSEDPKPLDQSSPPAASRSTAPALTADGCAGSNCKYGDEDNTTTLPDRRLPDRRRVSPPIIADGCTGSGCLYSDEDDPNQRRAPLPPIIPCNGSGC